MPDAPKNPPAPRPTMRSIAEQAGVSAMAVSLALRNHPSLPAKTRKKIQQVAARAGYQPDPSVAKLMHHLRARKGARVQATVCALTTQGAGIQDPYSELLLAGARRAAETAGFALEVFHVDLTDASSRRLQRMLRYRGVDGLMLLPMSNLSALDNLVDWREFSVVSTTTTVPSPHFHCALPSHFRNTLQLCDRLAQAGFERLGMVVREAQELRSGHNFTAALAWHGTYGKTQSVRAHLSDNLSAAAIARWLEKEKPDVIVAERDALAQTLRDEKLVPRSMLITTCSGLPAANKRYPFPGIHENPPRIGTAAVEILTGMITRGERGVPEHAQTTLIDGSWIDLPLKNPKS
ncbi:LacI family DNA-binding transcriptional regulator [Oleiharenicola lentus]|uniref:LacI family DNA-binding transcriptional regulator n=1 Tax=Oleiharenicola lentus TaxID=2508720 RepID=UPI003F66B628